MSDVMKQVIESVPMSKEQMRKFLQLMTEYHTALCEQVKKKTGLDVSMFRVHPEFVTERELLQLERFIHANKIFNTKRLFLKSMGKELENLFAQIEQFQERFALYNTSKRRR